MGTLDFRAAEFWEPYKSRRRVSLQDRVLGNTELVGKLVSLTAPLSNWMNEVSCTGPSSPPVRSCIASALWAAPPSACSRRTEWR
jgi:hypothetical protein